MNNHFIKEFQRSSTHKKAQGMVEFALILPLLLVLILGVIEFSRLMFAWIMVENSTRFGIRYATTGNYDEAYCPPAGCKTDAEVDAARIPSIKDQTRNIFIGFFTKEPYQNPVLYSGIDEADEEYFNITVCSTDPGGRVWQQPEMARPIYANCTLNGVRDEFPGAPTSIVAVATDYNFSFIVIDALGLFNGPASPFGAQPGIIHLASYREGVVEAFRATRAINTPLPLVVATVPTNTPTPSNTPSPTFTSSPTLTSSPTSSLTLTVTPSRTLSPTPTRTPTPSSTPTITRTPTITPVPSCSDIYISRTRFNAGNNFEASVTNNNSAPAFLTNASLVWNTTYAPTMYFDYANFAGDQYYSTNKTTSPINAPASPSIQMDGNGGQATWLANFVNPTFVGSWTVTMTFNFPGWGTCILTGETNNFTATPTLTRTPTKTRTPTPTNTITLTPSRTPTPSRTFTPTITLTPSKTFTPSKTPTPSKTNTPRPTRTPTPTRTITLTPSKTLTPSITLTPSKTFTPTATKTRTPTFTPSHTPSPTLIIATVPTKTPSKTPTVGPTKTPTLCFDC